VDAPVAAYWQRIQSIQIGSQGPERVAGMNASNGAAKPHSRPSNAPLAPLVSRKSSIETPHERLPGSKGSKGSDQWSKASYRIENTTDSTATLPNTKGSSPQGGGTSLPASNGQHAPSLPLQAVPLVDAGPQCGCEDLMYCVTYRRCPLCLWKDSPAVQEILEHHCGELAAAERLVW
jgi:hypothetical protein